MKQLSFNFHQRSETLSDILSDPSIGFDTSNGDSEEIIESEIEMILFLSLIHI